MGPTAPVRWRRSGRGKVDVPVFASPQGEQRFHSAYDAVLGEWPEPHETRRLSTGYGTTVVHVCGPANGQPVLLLHAGGSTAASWFANVGPLSRTCRIYAPDRPGEPGLSESGPTAIAERADWMSWLGIVLDRLRIPRCAVVGHSYGGWMALSFAIHAPHRVSQLALLDPTSCFKGGRTRYNVRSVPLLMRPSAGRMRSFLSWETRGRPMHPGYMDLLQAGAQDFPTSRIVFPTRPAREAMASLDVPVLVVLPTRSRQNHPNRTARSATQLIPTATVVPLLGHSHHSIPTESPDQLNNLLVGFLTSQ
jgi:pimeloyl-ACP methyl ester carboxylesterase